MFLTPSDTEKLLLSVAGMVARDRLERGIRLNHPETVALLSCWVLERAREGATVQRLMEEGVQVLRTDEVMDGVPDMLEHVQVEATFPDGRKLVTLTHPVRPRPGAEPEPAAPRPGEVRTRAGTVELNAGRASRTVVACNEGDRPVQVGSHIHLGDVNPVLRFYESLAPSEDEAGTEPAEAHVDGYRLDIAAGTSVRFQPGDEKRLDIVELAGARKVAGLQVKEGSGE
ncbi:urease subunit gamma/beta [Lipingzhangella halophila]|uniref:urease n=1 Tax=Lipingzhangella halophila TaxID=1783352 RepID=A0A7W7RE95_9ACTN|nr:urease subunit gamma [Lipingzhangella halophila]MBB4930230.1 urease subunit gamma/beta [Lipingzhangella halophila]